MGRSIAAVAVGIAGIVVPPGGISGDGLFQQCAEILQQGILPFVHKEGCGGMKRLQESETSANAGFTNQFLHLLSQVDQFESVPGRDIQHMRHNHWGKAGTGKLPRDFRLKGFNLRFYGLAIACPA